MKRIIFIMLFVLPLFSFYEAKTQETNSYEFYSYNYPTWFDSAKLGIMIHYGLYSVPSYSGKEQYAEWFYKGYIGEDTLRQNFVKRVYGENFNYFDFTKYFTSELFDADEWISLFKKSGANYIVFSSKHHDGFCLWDTKTTKKNSMNAPSHRDFIKELKLACDKYDMRFGLYYSLMEWDNPYYRWTIDTIGVEKYVDKYLIPQFKELVDEYKPVLIFADGDWDFSYKTLRSEEMVQYFYNRVGKEEAIINDRWGREFQYGFKTPEYSSGIKEKNRPWSECRSLSRSFGLNRNAMLEDYMSEKDLIHHFVQLVSLGGGLMLNVSPSADGQIPLLQQERLLSLGNWLSINGEAIYNSKPYKKSMDYEQKTDSICSETLDFNWVRNAPVKNCTEDNFAINWTNKFIVNKNTKYDFILRADDEASLEIIQNGKQQYQTTATKNNEVNFTFNFRKNIQYEMLVNYKENDIDANLSLLASKENEKPKAFMGSDVWKGIVSWQQPSVCYTTRENNLYAIVFNINSRYITLKLDRTPQEDMKVNLLGNEDIPLSWQYANGELKIDLSSLAFKEIKSKYAYVFCLKNYLLH